MLDFDEPINSKCIITIIMWADFEGEIRKKAPSTDDVADKTK